MPCFPTLFFPIPFLICSPDGASPRTATLAERPVLACPASFKAAGVPPGGVTCSCSAEATVAGTVWGSGVYTADSGVCRAALHAGAVGANGGTVTVQRAAGQGSYAGSARNGVESGKWGRYDSSFRFAGVTPAAPVAAAPPAPATPVAACPTDFRELAAAGRPVTCGCTPDAAADGSVWGTDVYTADSRICRAALHAGAINASGGTVTVIGEPGRSAYTGVSRNGVVSDNWGAFEASYRFAMAAVAPGTSRIPDCPTSFVGAAAGGQPLACVCSSGATASGNVWGTDVYTADSKICRAAVHAGATTPQGGTVTVVPAPGRPTYAGVARNGVTTESWGPFESSFTFDAAGGR